MHEKNIVHLTFRTKTQRTRNEHGKWIDQQLSPFLIFSKSFKIKRSQARKQVSLRCALKKVSEWRMSFLRIKKSPKQKRHCRKTVTTDLLPKSTVSLRFLDFQNLFIRRIKNTKNKNFRFHRNIQSMELRFGTRGRRIFFALVNREQCGALKKIEVCFFFQYFSQSLIRKTTVGQTIVQCFRNNKFFMAELTKLWQNFYLENKRRVAFFIRKRTVTKKLLIWILSKTK